MVRANNAPTPEKGLVMITTATGIPTRPVVWRPCATCWGQRRIFRNRNGEGRVPHTCPACAGVGNDLVEIG